MQIETCNCPGVVAAVAGIFVEINDVQIETCNTLWSSCATSRPSSGDQRCADRDLQRRHDGLERNEDGKVEINDVQIETCNLLACLMARTTPSSGDQRCADRDLQRSYASDS